MFFTTHLDKIAHFLLLENHKKTFDPKKAKVGVEIMVF